MTRLGRIHPYPAMIADELAEALAEEFILRGERVLDPFCGTGRTLMAAAARGADCIGIDVNPLAVLVTKAKSGTPKVDTLSRLLKRLGGITSRGKGGHVLEVGRKVSWFSARAKRELSSLIDLVNGARLEGEDLLFAAAILSATTRESSYCRQDQWKLHRITVKDRRKFGVSPIEVFERRLRTALREVVRSAPLEGAVHVFRGGTEKLREVLPREDVTRGFDVVLTSPPYGDSRTTVQYGAMSGICLGVIRHLNGINVEAVDGGSIDAHCLGGILGGNDPDREMWRPFWHGGANNDAARRVARFISDIAGCCEQVAGVLRKGGRAICVVSRRFIGGWRLYLDRVLEKSFAQRGLVLREVRRRAMFQKWTPRVINNGGRVRTSGQQGGCRVNTMRAEWVMVFERR